MERPRRGFFLPLDIAAGGRMKSPRSVLSAQLDAYFDRERCRKKKLKKIGRLFGAEMLASRYYRSQYEGSITKLEASDDGNRCSRGTGRLQDAQLRPAEEEQVSRFGHEKKLTVRVRVETPSAFEDGRDIADAIVAVATGRITQGRIER